MLTSIPKRGFSPSSARPIDEWVRLSDLINTPIVVLQCVDKRQPGQYGQESVVTFQRIVEQYNAKGEVESYPEDRLLAFSFKTDSPIIRQIKESFTESSEAFVAAVTKSVATVSGNEFYTLYDPFRAPDSGGSVDEVEGDLPF